MRQGEIQKREKEREGQRDKEKQRKEEMNDRIREFRIRKGDNEKEKRGIKKRKNSIVCFVFFTIKFNFYVTRLLKFSKYECGIILSIILRH